MSLRSGDDDGWTGSRSFTCNYCHVFVEDSAAADICCPHERRRVLDTTTDAGAPECSYPPPRAVPA